MKDATALNNLMLQQREAYALKVFDYQTVMTAMQDAATAGDAYMRLVQKIPASLKSTKAAVLLVAKLKAAGYTVEWSEAVQHERVDDKVTGAFIRYEELRISWGAMHVTCGPLALPAE